MTGKVRRRLPRLREKNTECAPPRVVRDGAVHGKATGGTNQEGHGGSRKEAHSRREAKKVQSASGKMVALGICEGGQQSP